MTRNGWTYMGLSIVGLALATIMLQGAVSGVSEKPDPNTETARHILLLVLVGCGLTLGWRPQASLVLKQALSWSAIFTLCLIFYSAAPAVFSIQAKLDQGKPKNSVIHQRPGVVSLTAERGGHFFVHGMVDGTYVDFMIDTGATLVSLSSLDAQRIGYDLRSLIFNVSVKTANGETKSAYVELDNLSIGDITVDNVQALIIEEGLEQSLLGMSFLSKLTSFELERDRLTLRQ